MSENKKPKLHYLADHPGTKLVAAILLPIMISLVSIAVSIKSLEVAKDGLRVSQSVRQMQEEDLALECQSANSPVRFFNAGDFDKSSSRGYRVDVTKPVFMDLYWAISVANASTEPTSIAGAIVAQAPQRVFAKNTDKLVVDFDDPVFLQAGTQLSLPHLIAAGDSMLVYLEGAVLLRGTVHDLREFIKAKDIDQITEIVGLLGLTPFGNVVDRDPVTGLMYETKLIDHSARPSYGQFIDVLFRTVRGQVFRTSCMFGHTVMSPSFVH